RIDAPLLWPAVPPSASAPRPADSEWFPAWSRTTSVQGLAGRGRERSKPGRLDLLAAGRKTPTAADPPLPLRPRTSLSAATYWTLVTTSTSSTTGARPRPPPTGQPSCSARRPVARLAGGHDLFPAS